MNTTYIFYDFETSTRELLGQIMSYSFIVTDENFEILDELNGVIRLNRTQIPELGAILTNKLNINDVQRDGDLERDAAIKIHSFLNDILKKYNSAILVGFNSNQFDLQFLRNTLIRYGINPYFMGKLQNLDILHFTKWIAFNHVETFNFVQTTSENGSSYYTFSLESLCTRFNLLTGPQSHNAKEDVLLTIALVKHLQNEFSIRLSQYQPIHFDPGTYYPGNIILGKNRVSQYADDENQDIEVFEYKYYLALDKEKKATLFLDLEAFENRENDDAPTLVKTAKYINFNKHSLNLEPLSSGEEAYFSPIIQLATQLPFIQQLSLKRYFELTPKDWDIEYQIHELGFERIDQLQRAVNALVKAPQEYDKLLKSIWDNRKDKKDKYLVQLFNRAYLNLHPNPKPEHLEKYLTPRYITGDMLRDNTDFKPLPERLTEIEEYLNNTKLNAIDRDNIEALKVYIETLIN